jgi:hypothetical protein
MVQTSDSDILTCCGSDPCNSIISTRCGSEFSFCPSHTLWFRLPILSFPHVVVPTSNSILPTRCGSDFQFYPPHTLWFRFPKHQVYHLHTLWFRPQNSPTPLVVVQPCTSIFPRVVVRTLLSCVVAQPSSIHPAVVLVSPPPDSGVRSLSFCSWLFHIKNPLLPFGTDLNLRSCPPLIQLPFSDPV